MCVCKSDRFGERTRSNSEMYLNKDWQPHQPRRLWRWRSLFIFLKHVHAPSYCSQNNAKASGSRYQGLLEAHGFQTLCNTTNARICTHQRTRKQRRTNKKSGGQTLRHSIVPFGESKNTCDTCDHSVIPRDNTEIILVRYIFKEKLVLTSAHKNIGSNKYVR